MQNVQIILDSHYRNNRIITLSCEYYGIIHSQLVYNKEFSWSVASNRLLTLDQKKSRYGVPNLGLDANNILAKAAVTISKLNEVGVSHSITNRFLNPFCKVKAVITATSYEYFIERCMEADVYMKDLGQRMKKALERSEPKELQDNQWHLPFIAGHLNKSEDEKLRLSAARCHLYTMGISLSNLSKEMEVANNLLKKKVYNLFEHQALPVVVDEQMIKDFRPPVGAELRITDDGKVQVWSRNFKNFIQARNLLPYF
jgi:hypothetical protein